MRWVVAKFGISEQPVAFCTFVASRAPHLDRRFVIDDYEPVYLKTWRDDVLPEKVEGVLRELEECRVLCKAKHYPIVACDAIKEMHRQVGDLRLGSDGTARRADLRLDARASH